MKIGATALSAIAIAGVLLGLNCRASQGTQDLSQLSRSVVDALASGRFADVFALFNSSHGPNLSPTSIGNGWAQILASSGAFVRIESVELADRSYHVATVTCRFEQGQRTVVIYFDDDKKIAAIHYGAAPVTASNGNSWRAPNYADPTTFREESVSVEFGRWRLPGTLTIPRNANRVPAVVLVAGSGPADADETVGPNKVFKDLAWGLATAGVAVLRYPKRTHDYPSQVGATANYTVKDEYIDDARAAVSLLALRPEIDPRRIFVAGHSEGGYLAPRIADQDPAIAGIIILEGNARPIERAVMDQLDYVAHLPGANVEAADRQRELIQLEIAAIEDPNLQPGVTVRFLSGQVPSSYFLDLRHYDPKAVAAKLPVPIDVVQGGRDFQVTTVDFARWKAALGQRYDVTLKVYPTVDHLLLPGSAPSTPAEYVQADQHVSQEVVHDLAHWISGQRGLGR